MITQTKAIMQAFESLRGVRSIDEIRTWVGRTYGDLWSDYGTAMADMVPRNLGGNHSSNVPEEFRVLERVSRGMYRLKR